MRRATKIWLLAAACLILLGSIVFYAAMSAYHWNFTRLSTRKYETNGFDINEEFKHISIDTDTADILFAPSENGKCYVECYEDAKAKHSVAVQEDTLVVNVIDESAWYDHIGINFASPRISVYLPKTETGDVTGSLLSDKVFIAKTDTGTVDIPQTTAGGKCEIATHTGDIVLTIEN